MKSIEKASVMDTELDMQRMVQPEVRSFMAVLIDALIWLKQDHRILRHPRRSIDLDHQEFSPHLYRSLRRY